MPASTDWETLAAGLAQAGEGGIEFQQPGLMGLVENGKGTGDL
jgi:hypothetical protein